MHQFDLLYMPSDSLYGSKYKYILAGIDAASRFKVVRPLRTKQARDVAEMIADIYKVGPLTCPKIFQCDNGSEFKGDVTRLWINSGIRQWRGHGIATGALFGIPYDILIWPHFHSQATVPFVLVGVCQ